MPSKPVNVTVLRVTSTMLDLAWSQPEQPNGAIIGYRLYYMHSNYTDVKTVRQNLPRMEYVLENLSKYFRIFLKK